MLHPYHSWFSGWRTCFMIFLGSVLNNEIHAQVLSEDDYCDIDEGGMTEFDFSKFVGKWYEVGHYPSKVKQDLKCTTVTIHPVESTSKVLIHHKSLDSRRADALVMAVEHGQFITRNETFAILAFYPPANSSVSYNILYTDYNTFALLWACDVIVSGRTNCVYSTAKYGWILSRERLLDQKHVNKYVKSLEVFGGESKYVMLTPQKDCNEEIFSWCFTEADVLEQTNQVLSGLPDYCKLNASSSVEPMLSNDTSTSLPQFKSSKSRKQGHPQSHGRKPTEAPRRMGPSARIGKELNAEVNPRRGHNPFHRS